MHQSSSTIMKSDSPQKKTRLHTPPFCNTLSQNNNQTKQQEAPKFLPPGVQIIKQLTDSGLFNSGGNGLIYVSQWMETPVAIKIVIDEKDSESYREEIQDEISILAILNHPLIVRMYGIILEPEVGIVMEYIDGCTLAALCTEPVLCGEPSKKINARLEQYLRYALDILKALIYLHTVGIFHCDLTPFNVMIQGYDFENRIHGRVKLIDFGRSRRTGNRYNPKTGGQPTRIEYAAPEAFLPSTKTITAAYDIYVFGVLLWQMFTAQTSYENFFEIPDPDPDRYLNPDPDPDLYRYLNPDPDLKPDLKPDLYRYLNPDLYLYRSSTQAAYAIAHGRTNKIPTTIPQQLQKIIEKCWAYEPTERPTAQKVLKELQKLLNVHDSSKRFVKKEAEAFYPSLSTRNVQLIPTTQLVIGEKLEKTPEFNVYEGFWLETEVIIQEYKGLSPNGSQGEAFQNFIFAAEILSQLNHPSVVRLYGIYVTTTSCGMVMEPFHGQLLQNFFQKDQHQSLSNNESYIAVDVTEGLAYLHSQNIVGALQIENIVFDPELIQAKLVLFNHLNTTITARCLQRENMPKAEIEFAKTKDISMLGTVFLSLLSEQEPTTDLLETYDAPNSHTGVLKDNTADCDEGLKALKELSTKCLQEDASERPTASDVLTTLSSNEGQPRSTRHCSSAFFSSKREVSEVVEVIRDGYCVSMSKDHASTLKF